MYFLQMSRLCTERGTKFGKSHNGNKIVKTYNIFGLIQNRFLNEFTILLNDQWLPVMTQDQLKEGLINCCWYVDWQFVGIRVIGDSRYCCNQTGKEYSDFHLWTLSPSRQDDANCAISNEISAFYTPICADNVLCFTKICATLWTADSLLALSLVHYHNFSCHMVDKNAYFWGKHLVRMQEKGCDPIQQIA